MSVEFMITVTVLFGFTAYYFWFHNRQFPSVPTISRLCGGVFVLLTAWVGAAYLTTPEVKSITVHEVMAIQTPVGTMEMIKVDNKIIDLGKIAGSDTHASKIKLTRYKDTVLGIRIPRLPLVESVD